MEVIAVIDGVGFFKMGKAEKREKALKLMRDAGYRVNVAQEVEDYSGVVKYWKKGGDSE